MYERQRDVLFIVRVQSLINFRICSILLDRVKPSIQTMELHWFSNCPTGEVCVITMQHRSVAVGPGKFKIDTSQKKALTKL